MDFDLAPPPLRANGVYDPNIFKAVFLAGGPGSGKSYTAKGLFSIPRGLTQATSGATGLKIVNSDPAFEHFLRKIGVDPSELSKLSPAEFKRVTTGPDSPRGKAKVIRAQQEKLWLQGRLGLIIDGTGDRYDKIVKLKRQYEALGYDCFMVYVNTSLAVAQERNAARARKLPRDLVEQVWSHVQENLGGFQALFGPENMIIVDSTKYGPVPANIEKAAAAFLRRPVRSPIAKEWIANELAAKVRRNPHLRPGDRVPVDDRVGTVVRDLGAGQYEVRMPGDIVLTQHLSGVQPISRRPLRSQLEAADLDLMYSNPRRGNPSYYNPEGRNFDGSVARSSGISSMDEYAPIVSGIGFELTQPEPGAMPYISAGMYTARVRGKDYNIRLHTDYLPGIEGWEQSWADMAQHMTINKAEGGSAPAGAKKAIAQMASDELQRLKPETGEHRGRTKQKRTADARRMYAAETELREALRILDRPGTMPMMHALQTAKDALKNYRIHFDTVDYYTSAHRADISEARDFIEETEQRLAQPMKPATDPWVGRTIGGARIDRLEGGRYYVQEPGKKFFTLIEPEEMESTADFWARNAASKAKSQAKRDAAAAQLRERKDMDALRWQGYLETLSGVQRGRQMATLNKEFLWVDQDGRRALSRRDYLLDMIEKGWTPNHVPGDPNKIPYQLVKGGEIVKITKTGFMFAQYIVQIQADNLYARLLSMMPPQLKSWQERNADMVHEVFHAAYRRRNA